MKAVALPSAGCVDIVELPMPEIKPYECLVKVLACGFCNSTDLKTLDDHLGSPVPFPVILGHEGVGEVVEVGSLVRRWNVGDRLTNPGGHLPEGCGYNPFWANMREYAIVQDTAVMEELGLDRQAYQSGAARLIPEEIDPLDAGVILSLAEAYSALDNFGFQSGMDALVVGDGPVGLALVSFLKIRGAGWVGCLGHHADRLERIRQAGTDLAVQADGEELDALLAGRRFDLVIDAVGSTHIILEAARRLKPGGKVGLYGVIGSGDAQLNLLELPNNVGVHKLCYPVGEFTAHGEIVKLATAGRIRLKDFYSHVVPMTEAARAVELIRSREAFKVILKF